MYRISTGYQKGEYSAEYHVSDSGPDLRDTGGAGGVDLFLRGAVHYRLRLPPDSKDYIPGWIRLPAEAGALIIRALGVSLFVTIVGTVLGTLLTTLMGYVFLSRPDYKLNGFLTMLVFIPMVFNGGLVSTYFIVSQFLHLKRYFVGADPAPVGIFL